MTARRAFLSLALAASAAPASAAVTGRVQSSDGKPVAGQDRRPLATAKSGADGSFRLEGDDALVAVGVRAEGSAPAIEFVDEPERPGRSSSRKARPRR